MNLRVIDGGRCNATAAPEMLQVADVPERPADGHAVLLEAERRLAVIGYRRWCDRQAATGIPVPRETNYLALQIRFAAKSIAALSVIPKDFRSDIYWP